MASASRGDVSRLRDAVPLTPFFFDILHLDGADLFDLPGAERYEAAGSILPPTLWVPRLVPAGAGEAAAFFDGALAAGHEGVVVKALGSRYEAGRRGAGWLKVKPHHTLDLVVLAAEAVHVTIDEPGHHGRRTQIDDLRAGRNLRVRADVGNPATLDDNDLIGQHRAGLRRVVHHLGVDADEDRIDLAALVGDLGDQPFHIVHAQRDGALVEYLSGLAAEGLS